MKEAGITKEYIKEVMEDLATNVYNSVQKGNSGFIPEITKVIERFEKKQEAFGKHLEKQDREMAEFKKEVSPMLRAFNESENTKIVWTKTGVTIKTTAGWIIVVGGAFAVIWGMLKYGAKLLIK